MYSTYWIKLPEDGPNGMGLVAGDGAVGGWTGGAKTRRIFGSGGWRGGELMLGGGNERDDEGKRWWNICPGAAALPAQPRARFISTVSLAPSCTTCSRNSRLEHITVYVFTLAQIMALHICT